MLSLTRDRLPYTKHCFSLLKQKSGRQYDHYVLDQGSRDGTVEWLLQGDYNVTASEENLGISKGLNTLLDRAPGYDVYVKFDNDCEPVTDNILRDVAQVAHDTGQLVAPTINGLNNPMPTVRYDTWAGWTVKVTAMVGGIFMAIPAKLFTDGFRFDDQGPLWGQDDTMICKWHRDRDGDCGYLRGHQANHYLTTKGQHADIPDYFLRTLLEGKPAL